MPAESPIPRPSRPSARVLLPLLAFALLVLAFKLLLIAGFANATPIADQWTIAYQLYLPLLNHTLSWADFFRANHEHRILTTRVLDIILLLINGKVWNPLLEMTINAVLHTATLFMLLAFLRPACLPGWPKLVLATTVLYCLPFNFGNTLNGFQSQFYFALFFSFLSLWLLYKYPPFSRGWLIGLACGALSFLSDAAGAAAPASAATLLLIQLWRGTTSGRRHILAAFVLAGLTLLAILQTPATDPFIDTGAPLDPRADTFRVFFAAFYSMLSWPTFSMAPIIYAPLLWFMWRQLRHPPKPDHISWFVFAMALWTLAQLTLLSYGRAKAPLYSRYDDYFSIGLLLNFMCMLPGAASVFPPADAPGARPAKRWLWAARLWSAGLLFCLLVVSNNALWTVVHGVMPQQWSSEQSIRAYLASGDFTALTTKAFPLLPPNLTPVQMQEVLNIPAVQYVLPPNLVAAHDGRQAEWIRALIGNLHEIGLFMLCLGGLVTAGWLLPGLRKMPYRS